VRNLKLTLKYLFAILFIAAGSNHFFNISFYLHIMPPYLPRPLLLVYLSGLAEIILGGLLLIHDFARAAAWGLVALLIAVFPANLHMAVNHGLYPEYSETALWARLPLQLVLIAWAYWYTRPTDRLKDGGESLAT
jgi:uncharacterized membrane protein